MLLQRLFETHLFVFFKKIKAFHFTISFKNISFCAQFIFSRIHVKCWQYLLYYVTFVIGKCSFSCMLYYILSKLFLVTRTPLFIHWNITVRQTICKRSCLSSCQYVRINLLELFVVLVSTSGKSWLIFILTFLWEESCPGMRPPTRS